MNATLLSLIAVTVSFTILVVWVYWPSRRSSLEALGRIPLENSPEEKKKSQECSSE